MTAREERWAEAVQGAVKMLRQERGLTLKQLAARSSLSESYLSEIEHGHKEPSGATLSRLADGFDLPLSMFIEYTGRTLREQSPGDPHPQSLPMSVQIILSHGSSQDIMELSRFADYLDWRRRTHT